jgi:formamidopyrimidine-DNA glycosylase
MPVGTAISDRNNIIISIGHCNTKAPMGPGGGKLPELPEVEVICRRLECELPGKKILNLELLTPSSLKGAGDEFPETLRGSRIRNVRRRGKLIVMETDAGLSLVIHLKMTGQLILSSLREAGRHCRLIMTFQKDGGEAVYLLFNDMRRFGYLLPLFDDRDNTDSPLKNIGPDALGISLEDFSRIVGSSGRRIKNLLLDQARIAGLGNIYVDEILHRAGVNPLTPAKEIPPELVENIHSTMGMVLERAIETGGSSVRNYIDSSGRDGSFQKEHAVYKRQGEPCTTCSSPIHRTVVAGRGTYFCPECQPPPDHHRPASGSSSREPGGC